MDDCLMRRMYLFSCNSMCEAAPIRKVSDIMKELHEHETGEQLHNKFVFLVIVFCPQLQKQSNVS